MNWKHLLVLAFLTTTTGCAKMAVAYAPSIDAVPPTAGSIGLVTTVDARPADEGGAAKERVGKLRNLYGMPSALKDEDPNVVERTVREATLDALKHAGVDVDHSGGRALTATVKHFWLDGYNQYTGTVTVEYTLKDATGATLWSKVLTGTNTAGVGSGTGMQMAQQIFRSALYELRTQAVEEFRSAAFVAQAK